MSDEIKLTSDQLGLMSLFQSVSGATARDCIMDEEMDRVIFLVSKGEMGLAIGKAGASIKNIQKMIGKTVELVEHSDDAQELIKNALGFKFVRDVRITEKPDGTKIAVAIIDQKRRGIVVGKAGRNAEKARLLARRYFQISTIQIVSPQ